MTEAISITQGFLAQTLFETERDVSKEASYKDTGEVFDTSVYFLSEAFRYLMETMARNPKYGVVGGVSEEDVKKLDDVEYSDLSDEQKASVDKHGQILEVLLKNSATRILILGLIEAYMNLEAQRAEISQDAD